MEPVLYAVTNVRQTQIVMVSLLYHALPARQTRIRLLAARHQRRAPATQATAGQQAGSVSAHDDGCWSFRRRLPSQKRHGDVCVDCPANSHSPSGSFLARACTCNACYSGPAGGPCVDAASTSSTTQQPTTSTTPEPTTTTASEPTTTTTTQEPTTTTTQEPTTTTKTPEPTTTTTT